jgi:hypothetical protein
VFSDFNITPWLCREECLRKEEVPVRDRTKEFSNMNEIEIVVLISPFLGNILSLK